MVNSEWYPNVVRWLSGVEAIGVNGEGGVAVMGNGQWGMRIVFKVGRFFKFWETGKYYLVNGLGSGTITHYPFPIDEKRLFK